MNHALKISLLTLTLPLLSYGSSGLRYGRFTDRQQKPSKVAESAQSQIPDNSKIKRVEERREAYTRAVLNLSPAEADKLWPVYRQFQTEWDAALLERHGLKAPAMANDKDLFEKEMAIDEKIMNIKRHYNAEFQKILPPEKIGQLYKAQRDFQDILAKYVSEKGNQANN